MTRLLIVAPMCATWYAAELVRQLPLAVLAEWAGALEWADLVAKVAMAVKAEWPIRRVVQVVLLALVSPNVVPVRAHRINVHLARPMAKIVAMAAASA